MEEKNFPILEFYTEKKAIIEPSKIVERLDVPDACIVPLHIYIYS